MRRSKKKSPHTMARKKAEKRKQETPKDRAARLEHMRKYVRQCRDKESESQKEERLKYMRNYARMVRNRQTTRIREQRFEFIKERFTEVCVEWEPPEDVETQCIIKVEVSDISLKKADINLKEDIYC